MHLLHFYEDDRPVLGLKTDRGIFSIPRAAAKLSEQVPGDVQELIAQGDSGLERIKNLYDKTSGVDELFTSEEETRFAPAVLQPQKIICVGLNYIDHAAESKMEIPKSPILFNKYNNALTGHKKPVRLPAGATQFDYEAELVAVIGKRASNVSEDEALDYVFGYTIGNDLSARDLQFRTGQWMLGKSSDGFAPIGPILVTRDELDPANLAISCTVNGEVRQSANTKDMIFNCAYLISYISKYMTLEPGDVIFTGTPDGVILGYPQESQKWLAPGDEIQVKIEGIGTLVNTLT
ncbi:fumarylacetoacetate hydrolase family protein [Arthrobacter sp. FW306-07-I]|uniref:fumarylacetoacetate hydrolase family protein n=1 Tax=Arthrobacter sp. FW306-07-I TaxID=2879622 RepID=UPI001F306F3E|nr:fumarylacetoacetate hydrolase family protein [Arthrobacter sp. FW306-07-I]UKA76182.1 fumarylacetoacetate hydrolase family protein [Arthrobacter sp. FW306-07-I]